MLTKCFLSSDSDGWYRLRPADVARHREEALGGCVHRVHGQRDMVWSSPSVRGTEEIPEGAHVGDNRNRPAIVCDDILSRQRTSMNKLLKLLDG